MAPNVPGFLKAAAPHLTMAIDPFWSSVYTYGWFIGFFAGAASYLGLMRSEFRR